MHRWITALVALLASLPAAAHDFWIEADPWKAARGSEIAFSLHVGHASEQTPWAGAPDRVLAFRRRSASADEVLPDALVYDQQKKTWSGRARADVEGVVVYALQSDETFSALPAAAFDAYVAEEGLVEVARARRGVAPATPGRERYSRRAKVLVLVGATASPSTPPAVGHDLEIVAVDNPFALADGAPLRLRVLYKGEPLAGASVKFESLESAVLPPRRAVADAAGKVAFAFPHRGAWKASVVWSEPISGDARADYRTIFASLTFGL